MVEEATFSNAQPQTQLTRRASELALMAPDRLQQAWADSPPARVDDLQGTLRAHFVYLRGEEMLPTGFRRLLRGMLFSPFFPLRSKRTRGRSGANRFGFGMGQIGFGRFDVRHDTAWDDDKEVLVLDYDVDENPAWLHPVRDEMCRLEPGLYLGRMGWRTQQRTWLGLFFTLERSLR